MKMTLSKCSLVVLLLLAANAYSVELQVTQNLRTHFRPLRQRMRNASEEVQNRINRRVQDVSWRQRQEIIQSSQTVKPQPQFTPNSRSPIFERSPSRFFVVTTTTTTTSPPTTTAAASSTAATTTMPVTVETIASDGGSETFSPVTTPSDDFIVTVTPFLTIITPGVDESINSISPIKSPKRLENPWLVSAAAASSSTTRIPTTTSMQNVPTSATSTKPSATIATVNTTDLQDADVDDEDDSEVTTDPAELETTTEPEERSANEDQNDVTTAQNDEQPTEAVTDFLNIDETTTTSTRPEVESGDELLDPELDPEVETEQSRSSMDSISSQLKKPPGGEVPEADEVAVENVEEEDIKLEVKWAEKVSTLEGTSMLIRIHASQNVEKVRLRYQHVNETSISNEVMDDAEIVLVPMNEESHEGQIVLRHLDHRGWYIICGEALKRQEVLESQCVQTTQEKTVYLDQGLTRDLGYSTTTTQASNPDDQLNLQSLIIIGVVVGLVFIFIILAAFATYKVCKSRRERKKRDEELRLRVEKKAQRERELAAKHEWAFDAVYADPDQPYEERCIM